MVRMDDLQIAIWLSKQLIKQKSKNNLLKRKNNSGQRTKLKSYLKKRNQEKRLF
jgi:hypothetical protein